MNWLAVMWQLSGVSYTANGLDEFDLTSADQAARSSSHNSSVRSSHHVHSSSSTQQLEQKNVPPDVANTLEHIVGQLDILTQVTHIDNAV